MQMKQYSVFISKKSNSYVNLIHIPYKPEATQLTWNMCAFVCVIYEFINLWIFIVSFWIVVTWFTTKQEQLCLNKHNHTDRLNLCVCVCPVCTNPLSSLSSVCVYACLVLLWFSFIISTYGKKSKLFVEIVKKNTRETELKCN